jgi:lysophospholipase L1-like esterase
MSTARIVAAFLILISVSSCAGESAPEGRKKLRYLALGDSYTIGQSVAREDSFPAQLARLLSKEGVEYEPQIIARTGWRTDHLSSAIDKADPKGPFDLVTLLIGVNNQFQGKPEENYKREFPELLERAIKFAGGDKSKVLVVSIPDYGVTPFGKRMDPAKIAEELDRYNKIARECADKAEVKFVDITPESRGAAKDPELVADDGLHPSKKMYAEWAKLIDEALKKKKD